MSQKTETSSPVLPVVATLSEDATAKLAAQVYGAYGAHAKAAVAFLDRKLAPGLAYKYFILGQPDEKLRDNAMQAIKMKMRREVEARNAAAVAEHGEDAELIPTPTMRIDKEAQTIVIDVAKERGADKTVKTPADKAKSAVKSAQTQLAKKIKEAVGLGVQIDKELTEAQATSGVTVASAIQAEVIDIARENMLTGLDATLKRLKPSECVKFGAEVLKVLAKHGAISAGEYALLNGVPEAKAPKAAKAA